MPTLAGEGINTHTGTNFKVLDFTLILNGWCYLAVREPPNYLLFVVQEPSNYLLLGGPAEFHYD